MAAKYRIRGGQYLTNPNPTLTNTTPIDSFMQNLDSALCAQDSSLTSTTKYISHYVVIFIAYTLAFGLMLLNTRGYYWDDWAMIGNFSFQDANRQWLQNGNIWYGHFHWIFVSLQPYGVALFRCFTFVAFLLCGFMVYGILRSLRILTPLEALFITLLFLLLPFNTMSRNVVINSTYTLCYLLFFSAFYLLMYRQSCNSTAKVALRLIALVLFFVAFTMNSLLVFYVLPLAYMAYVELTAMHHNKPYKSLFGWFIRHIDFIALPIIFYGLKSVFFKPYGLYEGYNSLHFLALIKAMITTPILSLLDLAHIGYLLTGSLGYIALLCLFILLLKQRRIPEKRYLLGIAFGFLVLWLGMFGYIAVNKHTTFMDLADRHGILESLGAAIIIVFVCGALLQNKLLKNLALGVLVCCTIECNIKAQDRVFRAYIWQVGVFEHLWQNPLFAQYDTLVFYQDSANIIYDNAFYQLNGIYKKHTKATDKFLATSQDDIQNTTYCFLSPVYNCDTYKGVDSAAPAKVLITDRTQSSGLFSLLSSLKMYGLLNIDFERFKQAAAKRFEVIIVPRESANK